jgi:protocatechuate 3,4-dioxygenase beta subunit
MSLRNANSRRRTLILLGAAGAGMLALPARAQPLPACVVTPAQTEGPFFNDERLRRSDIRTDPADGTLRPGTPLALTLRVLAVAHSGCTPLAGAMLDVWHCDAAGVYSGTADAGPQGRASRFLRGYQLTDADGVARFTTIYPGWYPERAVHIHFKVRTQAAAGRGTEFTSQLYFDEAVTDRVMALPPYASRGQRRVRNESDGIYRRGGGNALMAALNAHGAGYAARFDIGLRV